MSVEKVLRDMVANEVSRMLAPAMAELRSNSEIISRLAVALGQTAKRGPGRPARATPAVSVSVRSTSKRRGPVASDGKRMCAVMDCGRPARSKGYCAAHYQKFRMLDRTGRLPQGWVADAEPNSVENVALPRGRAGAKALESSKKSR